MGIATKEEVLLDEALERAYCEARAQLPRVKYELVDANGAHRWIKAHYMEDHGHYIRFMDWTPKPAWDGLSARVVAMFGPWGYMYAPPQQADTSHLNTKEWREETLAKLRAELKGNSK